MYAHAYMSQQICGGQRTACGNWFSLIIMQDSDQSALPAVWHLPLPAKPAHQPVVLNLDYQLDWTWNQLRDFLFAGLWSYFQGRLTERVRPKPSVIQIGKGLSKDSVCLPLLSASEYIYPVVAAAIPIFATLIIQLFWPSSVYWRPGTFDWNCQGIQACGLSNYCMLNFSNVETTIVGPLSTWCKSL